MLVNRRKLNYQSHTEPQVCDKKRSLHVLNRSETSLCITSGRVSSYWNGNMAFERAKEVRTLVRVRRGVPLEPDTALTKHRPVLDCNAPRLGRLVD
jgi:hypothetical protein